MLIEKLDGTTLRVTKVVEQQTQTDFKLDYLTKQRQNIIDQKERDNQKRDLEIAEVDELIAQCGQLNIVSESKISEKPLEVII